MSDNRTTTAGPSSSLSRVGRAFARYAPESYSNYLNSLGNRLRFEYNRRFKPDPSPAEEVPVEKRPIKVDTVEFYASRNAIDHHTDKYELVQMHPANPVLRRGQAFYVAIRFTPDREFNHANDTLKLILNFGPSPIVTKGTRVELPVGDNSEFVRGKAKWETRVHHYANNILTLEVHIPATVCVGLWKCELVTGLKADTVKTDKFSCKESIYIIFNPWCKEDAVFMKDDAERNEYVLSDVGKVYMGAAKRPFGKKWIFAQFDDIVLPCCVFILEKSGLDFASRGNVVKMVRAISAVVNHLDDDGVLAGRWDGKYEDGVAPWDWTGSLPIIEKYMKSGGNAVKYGQCWVFSGVTTTICRALGIPCRSVTNFVSAHDTDETITIDKYFDGAGDVIESENSSDSIWNYHVWNDCWMARHDLPVGYGGWQAIDATPQEASEDIYRAGPASLVAIIRGEIGFQYDTQFIFSEVNADVIHWQEDNQSAIGFRQMRNNKYHVGQGIYTKKVGEFDDDGDSDMENVIHLYKSPEGSEAERLTMMNAARAGGLEHIYDLPSEESHDVVFDLIEIDRITIGDPFSVKVQIENQSDELRTVYAILSTSSVYYTGVQANKIKKVEQSFTLQPKQKEELLVSVNADEYLDKLVDYSLIKIYAIAIVKETKQTWTEEDDFAVEKPKLELTTEGSLSAGKEFSLIATFNNPLKRPLHQGHFTFEGTGLLRPRTVYIRDVQPGETYRHVEKIQEIGRAHV